MSFLLRVLAVCLPLVTLANPAPAAAPASAHGVYLARPNGWQFYVYDNGAGSMCLGSGLESMATWPKGTFDFPKILAGATARAGTVAGGWNMADTIMFRRMGDPRPPWLVCKDAKWVDTLFTDALAKPYTSKDLARFKADLKGKPPVR